MSASRTKASGSKRASERHWLVRSASEEQLEKRLPIGNAV